MHNYSINKLESGLGSCHEHNLSVLLIGIFNVAGYLRATFHESRPKIYPNSVNLHGIQAKLSMWHCGKKFPFLAHLFNRPHIQHTRPHYHQDELSVVSKKQGLRPGTSLFDEFQHYKTHYHAALLQIQFDMFPRKHIALFTCYLQEMNGQKCVVCGHCAHTQPIGACQTSSQELFQLQKQHTSIWSTTYLKFWSCVACSPGFAEGTRIAIPSRQAVTFAALKPLLTLTSSLIALCM